MSFLMHEPSDYKAHMNPEGKLVPENRRWHQEHGTYTASYIIGAIIVSLGVLLCLHPWLPQAAAVGGLLVFGMALVTLSFLITTPQSWVPNLGDAEPRLSVFERQRATGGQGRDHDGRGSGLHGRFRQKISAPPRCGLNRRMYETSANFPLARSDGLLVPALSAGAECGHCF